MTDGSVAVARGSTEALHLAQTVLAAVHSEPGQAPASLRMILDGLDVAPDAGASLLSAVHESQLLSARLRRRAAELEALFSTARELVRLQDIDDVLSRLVQRAHELMGTDVTYLSELEVDSGDLIVRHSVGTVTPEFRDLHVPAGYGLASKVVQTQEPAWVGSYDTMQQARRDPHIDAAVAAEGLVSFLGVPLAVGDEVLGALFACNRFAHESSPEEVLLLSAFADHAAAVLHSARVLASAEAATLRAEQAYHELEKHLSATQSASAIHEELTTTVMSGGTVVDIVETLSRGLDTQVWALDRSGRPLNVRSRGDAGDLPSRHALDAALTESRTSGHVASIQSENRGWLVVAILGADRIVGAIVAEEVYDLPEDIARLTLERAAHVAALVSFKQDAVSAIRAERRSRWLSAVMEGRDPVQDASHTSVTPPEHLTGCTIFEIGERRVSSAAAAAEETVGETGFVAVHRDQRIVVAWTVADVMDASERLRKILSDSLREPLVTGVACVRKVTPGQLPAAVERASHDLSLLPALGVRGTIISSDAFAPYHALSSPDPETVGRFISDLIGPVLAWDRKRKARLFETLAAYFEGGKSQSAVAESLHIHKNTVQQRLTRIQALLDGDLANPEFRFRTEAAVRLELLRRSLRAATGAGAL